MGVISTTSRAEAGNLSSIHAWVPNMNRAHSPSLLLLSGMLSFIWGNVAMYMTSFRSIVVLSAFSRKWRR